MTGERLLLLVLTLMGLTACSTIVHPTGPTVTEPFLTDTEMTAADGAVLPLRVWRPASAPPTAVLIAVHGMNDYSFFFEDAGKALAEKGVLCVAYDQRGFGTGPHPGEWSSTQAMAEDLRTLTRLLAARHPGLPLVVLGESMGGSVTMVAFSGPEAPPVTGLILSAPGVWGRSTMGVVPKAALWLGYRLAPGWRLSGKGLKIMPSDNIEMLRQLSADPLVIKQTRIDVIQGVVDLMDAAQDAAPRLCQPLLALYGEHDDIIPAAATWRTLRTLPGLDTNQRVALYPSGYHMLLRDLGARTVWDDVAAWIADQDAPLPSGADRRGAKRLSERTGGS